LFCLSLSFGFGGRGDSQRELLVYYAEKKGNCMKITIEVNSSVDFDYKLFINWLNGELSASSWRQSLPRVEADIISVDGKKVY
jgi:hypothetical protein